MLAVVEAMEIKDATNERIASFRISGLAQLHTARWVSEAPEPPRDEPVKLRRVRAAIC